MKTLLERAEELNPHLSALRRQFHKEPEISGEEKQTALKIIAELQNIGSYDIRENVGGYGILADIGAGDHNNCADRKTIALRADIDALSIQEETALPFSSENKGVMHACGHDHHITCLLGAARLIAENVNSLHNNVRLIFQPFEEKAPVGGARTMIAAGALEDVDAVYGLHVWPDLPEGVLGVKAGAQMAASDHFVVRIHGKSAHGAMPHKGVDALTAGCSFVNQVQTVVSRNTDPLEPCVITIGLFSAGSAYNIIPEECLIEGTCRTYSPLVRDNAEKRLRELLAGICESFACTGELDYQRGYGALINDAKAADFMLQTWGELFGEENAYRLETPAMTAEDFSFYLNEKPGAFAWLGTQAKDDPDFFPLHSCHYKGNEAVLWKGAALLASLAMRS